MSANCLHYALAWQGRLSALLAQRRPVQLAMEFGAPTPHARTDAQSTAPRP